MKLYILKQNGILKIGITKEDDVLIRLHDINKHLSEDNKFELVTTFEMNSSPSLVEKLIHNYLGANKLNLSYLYDNMVIVDLECIINKTSGYSETFLSDTEKVKGIITLFGLCGYIDLSVEQLNLLDSIEGKSFDNLIKDLPKFQKMLDIGKKTFDYSCINNLDEYKTIKSLKEISEEIKHNKINVSFSVIGTDFYVLINNQKIKCDDLINKQNKNYLNEIFNSNKNIIHNIKPIQELYELQEKYAKEHNIKSKNISLHKEILNEQRKESLYKFINKNSEYLKDFVFNLDVKHALFSNDSYEKFELGYDILTCFFDKDKKPSKTSILIDEIHYGAGVHNWNLNSYEKYSETLDKTLNSEKLFVPDWDKDNIFHNFFKLADQTLKIGKNNRLERKVKDWSIDFSNNLVKSLYLSDNKKETLENIEKILSLIGAYYFKEFPFQLDKCYPNKEEAKTELFKLVTDNKEFINIANVVLNLYAVEQYDKKINFPKYHTHKEKKKLLMK